MVVRLKGGDPFLFGRGGEEIEVLARAGIPWEVVPGVSSAFGVPASAGIPVTQRGLASSVTVVTGRVGEPGPDGGPDWEALARAGGTLVILMGMTTRGAIAAALVRGGRSPATPVAVVERGTTPAERVARTTLAGLADVELGAPAVIVVGPVARAGHGVAFGGRRVGTAGRPDGGGDPLGPARPGPGRCPRAGGGVGTRAPTDPPGRPLRRRGRVAAEAATAVRDHRWVVLTSANAVERFMAELRDARALGPVLVAAVGPATADALRMAGVEPDLVPAEHSARRPGRGVPRRRERGRGRWRGPTHPVPLRRQRAGHDRRGPGGQGLGRPARGGLPHRGPVRPRARAAGPTWRRADAVSFAATSSVAAFLALRMATGEPVSAPPHVVCIGPTTAAAARSAGLAGVHEAWGSSAEGIVAELIDHFGDGAGTAS